MKTERLNLDQFKKSVEKSGELEKISGGVLGSCHCTEYSSGESTTWGITIFYEIIFSGTCAC